MSNDRRIYSDLRSVERRVATLEEGEAYLVGNVTIGDADSDVLTVTGQVTGSQGAYFAKKVGIGTATPGTLLEIFGTSTQLKLSNNADDYATLAVGTHGGLTITTVDAAAAAADLTFTLDGAFDVNANQEVAIDSTAASITVGAALADGQTLKLGKNGAVETIIAPHGTAGSEKYSVTNTAGTAVMTDGNSDAAVQLVSTAGGIGLRTTSNLAGAIQIEADGGAAETIIVKADQSTVDGAAAAGAIQLLSDAGGIGLSWNDGKDLWAEGGRAVVTANEDAADCIKLHADAGTSQTITVVNDAGTSVAEGTAAVQLLATAGGVGIRSTADLANAVNITADGGTDSTITIFNDQGTSVTDGAASIQLTSDVGRIELLSGLGAAKAIYLHTDGGTSESIYLHNTQGTGQGAITLHAPAGGAYILANKASAYGLFVDNNGGNQNRYAIKARGGADNGSGTTHYLYAEDGDGTAVGSIKNVSGTFQLADASDRRLKKNIVDTTIDALEIIADIKVRDFDWIKNDVHCVAGLIAQELQEAFPSAADGSEDQVDPETGETIYMTASRDVLVPVLVKAVQELTARVAALEAG
jgi:hypothetical protein